MDNLYANRDKTGDIKFVVGTEVIPAHRCMLAALSPKYQTQFYGSMPEKNVITVTDVSPAAFKEFLQFFYADNVTLSIAHIEDVLNLVKQSLNEKLLIECTDYLLEMVGLDKLCWCYQLALFHDIKPLNEFCEEHISINIKKVFQSNDFLRCNRDVLCRILSLDSLKCTEVNVFDACIQWAQSFCKQKSVDSTNMVNVRDALDEAIFKIRFGLMTVEEFAAIDKKYSGLLTTSESNAVYRAIGKATDTTSSVFSTNCKPRVPKTAAEIKSDEIKTKPTLECAIIDGRVQHNWGHNRSEYDAIAFVCDKAIKLHGFSVCLVITDALVVDLVVGARKLANCKHSSAISKDKTAITKITFDKPIEVSRNECCFIKVKSKKFQQPGPRYAIKDEIAEDGVWFQFLRSTPGEWKPKSITHLIFNIGQ